MTTAKAAGNDEAIQYIDESVRTIGKRHTSERFGIPLQTVYGVYADEIDVLPSLYIRRVLRVKMDDMKKSTQIEMRGVLHKTLDESKYKGTRKRQENTKYRERVPSAFLDAMELD